ncbi:MAG: SDR family NAD(P)-dependent oxidoreductase [Lachnospiraceae bacterium]|nr:SDR family NAD(P)-dependent oxidoreductase [Lachnospiraceae bacterium]
MRNAAIITGASRGIGRACAIELSNHFDTIVINSYSNPDALKETQSTIESMNTHCLAYIGDIGDYNFVCTMIKDVLTQGYTIDLLVNNAGCAHVGLLSDMTYEDWERLVHTNLTSVFNCCNQIVPHMVSNKSGHIINISSMWGISGASCEVAYSATKGGVNAFTKALAKELAPSNIRVNALACGAIQTEMNSVFSKEDMDNFCQDIPACRLGTPEEIAKMVWQLYNTPFYLTGEVIKIDGGYL